MAGLSVFASHGAGFVQSGQALFKDFPGPFFEIPRIFFESIQKPLKKELELRKDAKAMRMHGAQNSRDPLYVNRGQAADTS